MISYSLRNIAYVAYSPAIILKPYDCLGNICKRYAHVKVNIGIHICMLICK